MPFSFEKLSVYKKSLILLEEIEEMSKTLKGKIEFEYIDQLKRAALSIPLNIAEANGRWHKNDRKQFYYISRGSTFECVPLDSSRFSFFPTINYHSIIYHSTSFPFFENVSN